MPFDLPFQNLAQMLMDQAARSAGRTALMVKRQDVWQSISWSEFRMNVIRAALGLRRLGIGPGDRIALLSENRPEWAFTDFGALTAGAATVPIYATSSLKESCYVVRHSDARAIFVSNQDQFSKIQPLLVENPKLTVITFDGVSYDDARVIRWESFLASAEYDAKTEKALLESIRTIKPDDVATLIYTSGTTGPPKGVMLTHANFLVNCADAREAIPLTDQDVILSFLPLSHVFERMAGFYFPVLMGATIAYAENMNRVPDNLVEIRPTMACSVPRLYEKIYAKVMDRISTSPPALKAIAHWALRVAAASIPFRLKGAPMPVGLRVQYAIADGLVFRKIRRELGGRLKFFISGGAPLARQLGEFFYGIGVTILEGYGLTETSPVITVNRLDRLKFGTVGIAFKHVEVRIADDGEVLAKGPSIMKGYYQDSAATNEAIREGWFYTGDIGLIDHEGFLVITDRKKDIIVTSGGKNIAPQNIENALARHPAIPQAVVVGDKKNFLVALIVPNFAYLTRELKRPDIMRDELIQLPQTIALVAEAVEEQTADFPNYERIKYFRLLPSEFTQDGGELTPTLKVKRKVVSERYRHLIEDMYREAEKKKVP